jgi:hypothetical protein
VHYGLGQVPSLHGSQAFFVGDAKYSGHVDYHAKIYNSTHHVPRLEALSDSLFGLCATHETSRRGCLQTTSMVLVDRPMIDGSTVAQHAPSYVAELEIRSKARSSSDIRTQRTATASESTKDTNAALCALHGRNQQIKYMKQQVLASDYNYDIVSVSKIQMAGANGWSAEPEASSSNGPSKLPKAVGVCPRPSISVRHGSHQSIRLRILARPSSFHNSGTS